jgi:FixJ family two-component response regulator
MGPACFDVIEIGLVQSAGVKVTIEGGAERWVAVVDDDESVRSALIPALRSVGLEAFGFDSAESFLGFGRLPEVGCLITDVKMPGMSGLELQAKLRREGYLIPIVFMTAYSVPADRAQAMAAGAIAFLDKPFDDNFLLETVRRVIRCGKI